MRAEKVPKPATVQPRPYFLINQIQLAMVGPLERSLSEIGLTPAIARVLNAIAVRPRMSSSALARMIGITPQSIKQSTLALEAAGLIKRIPSTEDHRVLAVQITPKGWRVREKHMAMIQEMYAEVFQSLTAREMDTLVKLLTKTLTSARPQAMAYFATYDPQEPEEHAKPARSSPRSRRR